MIIEYPEHEDKERYISDKYHNLVIDAEERLYFSIHYCELWIVGPSMGANAHLNKYCIQAFDFGDDPGQWAEGGDRIIIMESGIYTNQDYEYEKHPVGHGSYSWVLIREFNLFKYNSILDVINSLSNGYAVSPKPPSYNSFLPLPDDRVLVTETDYYGDRTPILQLLDENWNMITENDLGTASIEFAFDPHTGQMYASTADCMYCYDWNFNELWNTELSAPEFYNIFPVITDNGNIVGLRDGIVMLLSHDGSIISDVQCGAYQRPVVLNDGTIAVICDSSILYFDSRLVQIDEKPLPTGAGTGESYAFPPLVDSNDNMALVSGAHLYIINRNGDVISHKVFESGILEIRLGPEHLFVVLENEIIRLSG